MEPCKSQVLRKAFYIFIYIYLRNSLELCVEMLFGTSGKYIMKKVITKWGPNSKNVDYVLLLHGPSITCPRISLYSPILQSLA